MEEVSSDGATAVARYFLALYPYVVETGDTVEWDRFSHPECVFCADVHDRFAGKPSDAPAPTSAYTLVSAVELEPGAYFSVRLSLIETYLDGGEQAFDVLVGVLREGDGWLVRGVQIDEADPADG